MKNYKTFAQLDRECLEAAGLNDQDIKIEQREQHINDCAMKVYNLLDGLLDPFYDMTAVLTLSDDIERLPGDDTITAIDATNESITRNTGSFTAGSIASVSVFIDPVQGANTLYHALIRILESGTTATYEIIKGTLSDHPDGASPSSASAIVIKSFSDDVADISSLYVKEIKRIYDDQTRLNLQSFDEILDGLKFAALHRDPVYKKRIAYHHRGEVIQFYIGESAVALGVVTMEYRGKINMYSEATADNTILIPPEYNIQLKDEVTAAYLQGFGKPVPMDLAARKENYQKLYDAANARKVAALEIKGK